MSWTSILGSWAVLFGAIRRKSPTAVTENSVVQYTKFKAYAHFGGGLSCGLSGLAAGLAIGVVGDVLTRASAKEPKLFVGMVLILIFAEALGLYGLIVGLILSSHAGA